MQPADARYVARQAIVDAKQRVVGYELLFRDGTADFFRGESVLQATSSVIAQSFLTIGLDTLTSGRPAFVNFSRESLLRGFALLLPPAQLVVEVLETVTPDPEVVSACRGLKANGYAIALDDFEWSEARVPLVRLADIVKIDFLATRGAERRRVARMLRPFGVKLLAEKVETRADFRDALEAGFEWFQGFFFSRPSITGGRDLHGFERPYLQILEVVSSPHCDLRAVEGLVRRDLALTYKLMRRANSAVFGKRSEANSLRYALAWLGLDEVRKWVALLTLAGLAKGKPTHRIRSALLRARFCEEIAACFELGARSTDLFLTGLLSEVDALLDRPMSKILRELALAPDVADAIGSGRGVLAQPLRCAVAWERGDWPTIAALADELPARGDGLAEAFVCALEWTREFDEWVDSD